MKDSNLKAKSDTSLVLILQDEYGGFDVEETMIIKDQKRLKSFYAKINRTRKPGLPVPEIDFSKEMVVVHCSGEQNKSKSLVLSQNRETNNQVFLDYEIIPEPGASAMEVITHPFCVYKMPMSEKEILVEKKH